MHKFERLEDTLKHVRPKPDKTPSPKPQASGSVRIKVPEKEQTLEDRWI